MTQRYTPLDFELAAHDAREATPATTRPLYPRGTPQPSPAPWQPPASQGLHGNDAASVEKFWERPLCLECMSVVIVNVDPHVWHCTNLSCGRGGWVMHGVRVLDQERAAT